MALYSHQNLQVYKSNLNVRTKDFYFMNKKLLLWAITSALAGFLFGFDTVVISGAESKIQQLWSLSSSMHGLAISAALWGTVLGSLFRSIPAARYGRKKTLIINGVLFLVGAVGSAVAWDVSSFFIFRFIGGLGIGISTIAAPLFISEISPAGDRGKLTGLFQFNIVFGILIAFFSNFVIAHLAPEATAWRWMLGIQVIPSIIYTLLCFTLPESPRWLIVDAKNESAGKEVFRAINPTMAETELNELVSSVKSSAADETKKVTKTAFFSKRLRYPILFAFLIAAFDGIRLIDLLGRKTLLLIGCVGYIVSLSVCTYAFFHFNELKVVSTAIDTASSAEKLINMESNTVYFTAEDKTNAEAAFATAKDSLLKATSDESYTGAKVAFDGQSLVEVRDQALNIKHEASSSLGSVSLLVLICMVTFIASHAIGSGTIIWVFISEIFPNDHRAAGQSLGSATHWVFAAGLTLLFPIAIANFDAGYMFGFFAFMMIVQIIWCAIMMPETKGRTLEEIGEALSSK